MCDKVTSIIDSILANKTDISIVTETWVNDKKRTQIDADFMSSLSGFSVRHMPRNRRKGGGIAILTRNNLKVTKK